MCRAVGSTQGGLETAATLSKGLPDSSDRMYLFLDVFFFLLHSLLIAFVMTGWAMKRTRKAHLGLLGLTMLSWLGLGTWYGFGYCPFTDWHWQVKRKLGEFELPGSYVKYYLDSATGWNWDGFLVDLSVAGVGLAALGLNLIKARLESD